MRPPRVWTVYSEFASPLIRGGNVNNWRHSCSLVSRDMVRFDREPPSMAICGRSAWTPPLTRGGCFVGEALSCAGYYVRPQCQQPAELVVPFRKRCGRQYRTQVVPPAQQTQMFSYRPLRQEAGRLIQEDRIMNRLECQKCGGAMEDGWLPGYPHPSTLNWAEGKADTGWSGVLKGPKKVRPIVAYRCSECGSLELFAQ